MRVHLTLGGSRSGHGVEGAPPPDSRGVTSRLAGMLTRRGHRVTVHDDPGGKWNAERAGAPLVGVDEEVDLLVCIHGDPPPEITARVRVALSMTVDWPRDAGWDVVVVASGYHADRLRDRVPGVPTTVIAEGCEVGGPSALLRDRFLYAAPPEWGLHRLLSFWPEIWRRFGVPLSILGDVRAARPHHSVRTDRLADRLRLIEGMLDQPGVVVHGSLTEVRSGQLYARGLALLHPLDPLEADAVLSAATIRRACAAGCPPILAPVDALPSECHGVARFVETSGAVYTAESWIHAIDEVLDTHARRVAAARNHALGFPWDGWATEWERLLTRAPHKRKPSVLHPQGAVDMERWRPPALIP